MNNRVSQHKADIQYLYLYEHWTALEIAKFYGVTHQAISNHLRNAGINGREVKVRRNAIAREKLKEQLSGLILDSFEEHRRIGRVIDEIQLGPDLVRSVLDEHRPYWRNEAQAFTRDDQRREKFIVYMRAASEHQGGKPLTRANYDAYASKLGLPSGQTIPKLFGSWGLACQAADVPMTNCARTTIDRPTRSDRKWHLEDCSKALRDFSVQVGGPRHVTAENYHDYSKGRSDVPCMATVRARSGGSWHRAWVTAFQGEI